MRGFVEIEVLAEVGFLVVLDLYVYEESGSTLACLRGSVVWLAKLDRRRDWFVMFRLDVSIHFTKRGYKP